MTVYPMIYTVGTLTSLRNISLTDLGFYNAESTALDTKWHTLKDGSVEKVPQNKDNWVDKLSILWSQITVYCNKLPPPLKNSLRP